MTEHYQVNFPLKLDLRYRGNTVLPSQRPRSQVLAYGKNEGTFTLTSEGNITRVLYEEGSDVERIVYEASFAKPDFLPQHPGIYTSTPLREEVREIVFRAYIASVRLMNEFHETELAKLYGPAEEMLTSLVSMFESTEWSRISVPLLSYLSSEDFERAHLSRNDPIVAVSLEGSTPLKKVSLRLLCGAPDDDPDSVIVTGDGEDLEIDWAPRLD